MCHLFERGEVLGRVSGTAKDVLQRSVLEQREDEGIMGKKLGNALIIYGVLNFLVVLFIPGVMNGVVVGAFAWMIIMIVLGSWQRGKARAQESRDKQTQLLEQMSRQQEQQKQTLNDAINKALDQRQQRRTGEFNN